MNTQTTVASARQQIGSLFPTAEFIPLPNQHPRGRRRKFLTQEERDAFRMELQ